MNSTEFLERASLKEAVAYEIERAEANSKLSLSLHNQFETQTLEYKSIFTDREVVTGYSETIAPLVMDSSHFGCATSARTDRMITSSPENLDTSYDDDEIIGPTTERSQNAVDIVNVHGPTTGHSQNALATGNVHASPRERIDKTASASIEHTVTCGTTNNYCSSTSEKW